MISVFKEYNKLRSGIVQLLVQKYIEIETKSDNIFMYSELNNDIDAFNVRLENIEKLKEKFQSPSMINTPPTDIEAFIEEIPDDSYISSYEVKHTSSTYLLLYKNIYQLISKHSYQDNTELWLILVPTTAFEIGPFQEQFTKIKEEIKLLTEIHQKILFNELLYNEQIRNKNVIDAINFTLARIYKGKINIDNIKITDDDFNKLKKNLLKIQIRVIPLSELLEIELDKDFIKRFMFI